MQTTVCERFEPQGVVMLRGAALREVRGGGATPTVGRRRSSEFDRVLRERSISSFPAHRGALAASRERHLAWQAS